MLTVSPGTWTGSPTFGYQWQRSTSSGGWSSIGGATADSYTATSADTGLSLQVVVTAQNDAGSASTTAPEIGPVTNPSGECTVTPTTDTDRDGVPDCKEIAGFTLNVATTGTGAVSQRKVTSDPNNADTDGDKIADGLEWQGFASDPSTADTDGDGLSDYEEFIVYKSLPANVDSDGDAVVPNSNPRSADPRLLDGSEVHGYGFAGATISTSPTLSDTDGDSLSDYSEINGGGFNPLVADMPKLDVGVPDNVETDIQIFTTRKDGTSSTTYKGTTTTTTDSKKTHAVDLTNVKTLNTNSTTLDVGGKGGYAKGKPYGEAHLNIKSTWQTGTVTDHQTGSTTDTVHTTQQRYQEYRQDTSTSDVETAPNGTLSTAITLHNSGTVTFTAKDLTVTAFRTDPNNPGSIQPIATLALASSVGDITLAPGDTKGPFQVSSTTVSSDLLVELLANPDGIIYSVPTPSLVNPANGQSYAVVGQNVQAQTAGVGIDDGSGEPRTYLVATNVARNPDGSAAGIQLKTVLDSILHTDYSTCNQNDGRQVLCRIGTVSSTDEDHFWSILSSTDVAEGGNFDDLHLQIGSVARLVYLVDTDADQLFDPQENLYGTDIAHADTDSDGLTDYDETQTGWQVPKIGSQAAYQVYPSPLSADVDGDGSPDGCPGTATTCAGSSFRPESVRKTDPNLPDTNSDGLTDGSQDLPDALLYCPGCYRAPDFASSLGNGQGDGDGQFGTYESFPDLNGPGAIAVNRNTGDLYVADPSNHRVEKFGSDGKFDLSFGSKGAGDGQFDFSIAAIAVDKQGNVYVSDITLAGLTAPYNYYKGRLQKFTSTGTHLATVSVDAYVSLAVDAAGNVFASTVNYNLQSESYAPAVVHRYSPTLKLLATYTDAKPLNTGVTVGPDGRIFLTAESSSGATASVIQRWTPPSLTPDALSDPFTGATLLSPVSDPHGLLYVADSAAGHVLKLSPDDYTSYVQIGGPGSGNGQFSGLHGVAVDNQCNLYVSDGGNFRVQMLSYGTGCN